MPPKVDRRRVLTGLAAAAAIGPIAGTHPRAAVAQTGAVSVFASGLTNPRGFAWAEDGTMYIGLAGDGVTVTPPASPDVAEETDPGGTPVVEGAGETFVGTETASIARIENGCPATVASGFPSGGPPELGWDLGVDDVEVMDGQLYALVGGGGEAYGHPGFPNGVYQVNADGSHVLVADLSAWFRENPVAEPHQPVSPDAQPFTMVGIDGTLWIVEANHQQVMTVAADGAIARVADLSVVGNVAPSGIIAAPEGGVYVSFLSALPFADGSARVVHVAADGTVTDVWTGLTTAVAVAIDADGALLALEMATGNSADAPWIAPGTGKVVRRTGPDSSEDVVTGLDFPVKMAFGPDGALYTGAPAFGATAGEGQVLRIDLGAEGPIAIDGPLAPSVTCQV